MGQGAFHSTTYQPNTIASLHFLKCLPHADPEFHATVAGELVGKCGPRPDRNAGPDDANGPLSLRSTRHHANRTAGVLIRSARDFF